MCKTDSWWKLLYNTRSPVQSSVMIQRNGMGDGREAQEWGDVCVCVCVCVHTHLQKDLPAKQETQVWSLSWEDPLEKEMTIHSSILAWRIPWTGEPGGLQSMGSQRHDWAKNLPAKQERWVQSLGWEDPLENEMAAHFNIFAWKNPMYGGSWQATRVPKCQAWLSN